MRISLFLALLFPLVNAALCADGTNTYQAAADYLESKNGHAMLVYENGELVFEQYFNGWKSDQGHRLASGTKSFAGAMLAAAMDDKLLTLDEPISDTITEWQSDPKLAKISIRQLLSLTSGIHGGSIGSVPSYAEALAKAERKHAPGVRFSYGPVPFQLFGEIMRRKLSESEPAETVDDYLNRKILKPIGCEPTLWRKHEAGQPRLPSGCVITAREWAAFGLLMVNCGEHEGKPVLSKSALQECWTGSKINPRYGLGFWLNDNPALPKDLVMAAGMGKQKLFIIPSRNLLIVQFAEAKGYDQNTFLKKVLGGNEIAGEKAKRERPAEPGRLVKARFTAFDKNNDGNVTADEVRNPDRLKQMDQNKDGHVNLQEYWAHLRSL